MHRLSTHNSPGQLEQNSFFIIVNVISASSHRGAKTKTGPSHTDALTYMPQNSYPPQTLKKVGMARAHPAGICVPASPLSFRIVHAHAPRPSLCSRCQRCAGPVRCHNSELESSRNHDRTKATAAVALAVSCMLNLGVAYGTNDLCGLAPPRQVLVDQIWGLQAANAALLQMPPVKLNNRYYLVRAGESIYEQKGIINTNPVAKTSLGSGLSEEGKIQTMKAAVTLKAIGACEGSCWIWPSINQRAYQTAEIIAFINDINRSRIVPEYSFLDARGLGAFEGRPLILYSEVHEMDSESSNWRPPPFTDGTPNESVADVFVRLTQLMSILETQYLGESIVIVSPDSDNLSVLQAALTGLDLRSHSRLSFAPGEVRSVDLSSLPPPPPPLSGLVKCYNPPNCR